MNIINRTCAEIQTDGGYEYRLDSLKQTSKPDCEQSWYLPDGRLIADPSNPHKLMDPVSSVSSDRIFTSYCMDELRHEIQCHFNGITRETLFRAFNDSIDESTPTAESHQFWWLLALLFIIVLLLLIFFSLREKIFSCFSGAPTKIFQGRDSENRDPEAAVQTSRSESNSCMTPCSEDDESESLRAQMKGDSLRSPASVLLMQRHLKDSV